MHYQEYSSISEETFSDSAAFLSFHRSFVFNDALKSTPALSHFFSSEMRRYL